MSLQSAEWHFYHLKNIRNVKIFLSQDTLITVVHAFVTSLIANCNSLLLYGTADHGINRLQPIQNEATLMVTNK